MTKLHLHLYVHRTNIEMIYVEIFTVLIYLEGRIWKDFYYLYFSALYDPSI